MPNAKVLSEKQAIVAELTEKIQKASAGVLVDYKGITVEEDTALRKECRENGIHYAVVKNTLLRFAFNNTGLNELDDLLNGTTSLALCEEDVVAPARVMSDYAKKLNDKAAALRKDLWNYYRTELDLTGNIGKRYRRQDEIGTPYCVTYDFESDNDNAVTVRDRDTMAQERVSLSNLKAYLDKKVLGY